ncbi:MAG: hypothetical protein IEMM0008_1826 [bacterium]|nr:MAG: hypothetical protein IEMM0008_1826 [bacterium]
MKVFITGGTGYVGQKVIPALLRKGHEVICLVRKGSEDKLKDLSKQITIVSGDLLEPSNLNTCECEAVIHLVAIIKEFPEKSITFERYNFESAKNMIDVAEQNAIDRFILMSAVGNPPGVPKNYYRYKLKAEDYLKSTGLHWTILKPSLIYDQSWSGKSAGWVSLFNWSFALGSLVPAIGDRISSFRPISRSEIADTIVEVIQNKKYIGESLIGRDLMI